MSQETSRVSEEALPKLQAATTKEALLKLQEETAKIEEGLRKVAVLSDLEHFYQNDIQAANENAELLAAQIEEEKRVKKAQEEIAEIENKIQELEKQKENLKGASNKKKRAVVNKKLKKLKAELDSLVSPSVRLEDLYDFGYMPKVPQNWFAGEPSLAKYKKKTIHHECERS